MNFFASFTGGGGGGGTKKSKNDPQELGKEWKRNLAKEVRKIERDIGNIKREEAKALQECKNLAKKGRVDAAKILAKEVESFYLTHRTAQKTLIQLSYDKSNSNRL